jgi:hypothetical protein
MQPIAMLSMIDVGLPLLMEINVRYGGILRVHKRAIKIQPASVISWRSQESLRSMLSVIEPYLVLKREQAKLTLWWVRNIPLREERWGISKAKDIFSADLKAMKGNMLLSAEDSIARIEACFTSSTTLRAVS